QQQDSRSVRGRNGVPLVRLEHAERAGARLDRVASGLDPRPPVEDEDVRVLFDLVLAERLSRVEDDEDRPGCVLRVENDRRAATAFDLNLVEVPAPHERPMLTRRASLPPPTAARRPSRAGEAARLDSAA